MKKNITRTLSLILIAFALFALAACGKGKNAVSNQKNEDEPKNAVALFKELEDYLKATPL